MNKTAGYYFREIKETNKEKIIRNSTLISVSDL